MLSHLHGAGKIDFRKNRTNWSYVSRFKGSDEQRRLFRGLTALFDDVWYGLKPPRGVNIDTVKDQVAQLMNHA